MYVCIKISVKSVKRALQICDVSQSPKPSEYKQTHIYTLFRFLFVLSAAGAEPSMASSKGPAEHGAV